MKLNELTPADWQGIADYISYLRDAMSLQTWHLYLSHKPCGKSYQASISPTFGRRHASIYLSRTWPTVSPQEQKQTLIHELLHLYLLDAQSVVEHTGKLLEKPVFAFVWAKHLESLEYAIDAIAEVLAVHLDDPPYSLGPVATDTADTDIPTD